MLNTKRPVDGSMPCERLMSCRMRYGRWALMIAAMPLLVGCVTLDSCDWAVPIRPSAQDVLTQDTVEQILLHNTLGERLCGWRP